MGNERDNLPTPSKASPSILKVLSPPQTVSLPLAQKFPFALRAISHYLFNILPNKGRFNWIVEQYTSKCC